MLSCFYRALQRTFGTNVLLKDKRSIDFKEYGAGSKVFSNGKRYVNDIIKHNAISNKQGLFLTRLVNFLKPHNILEFGTSLGFSTIYMALKKRPIDTETVEKFITNISRSLEELGQSEIASNTIGNPNFDIIGKALISETRVL